MTLLVASVGVAVGISVPVLVGNPVKVADTLGSTVKLFWASNSPILFTTTIVLVGFINLDG